MPPEPKRSSAMPLIFGATFAGVGLSTKGFPIRAAAEPWLAGDGLGLAAGLGLAITTLLIRESSLSLKTDLMVSAAVTLVFMITVQSIISVAYVYFQDKQQLRLMLINWRLCLFVGITSVLGSIGWFTATSFQTAAYVKALGQVEFFITLALTYRLFKEKITLIEYLGMFLIVLSVFILLLWA